VTEASGYSLLAKNGFKNISNYSQEWLNGLRKINNPLNTKKYKIQMDNLIKEVLSW
jgi:hypothetical protein